ncbi:MAG: hypothetical protein PHY08_14445 [Candidatus Cloacimonetes bacterium]|nr:hypothetical protein [Candidatus Cloacimonadota bacterium]
MKKMLLLILMFMTTLSVINFNLKASDINLDGYTSSRIDNVLSDWNHVFEEEAFYIKTEKKQLLTDYIEIRFINRDLRPLLLNFDTYYNPYSLIGSKLLVYDSLESLNPSSSYNLTTLNQIIEIDETKYYQLSIKMDDKLHANNYTYYPAIYEAVTELLNVANSTGLTNNVAVLPVEIKAYSMPTVIDPQEPSFVDSLPLTNGSIFSNPHLMDDVDLLVNGNTVTFTINHDGSFYSFTQTFSINTDMTIFNNNYEIKYYTHESNKFILFNHGSESMFYFNDFENGVTPDKYPSTFIPYTIWNLNTNETSSTKTFDLYVYAKEEDSNNVYAYFYVDEFVIDRLISVTATIEYRYKSLIGTVGDWKTVSKVLEDENINPGNIDWKFTAAAISSTATVIGSMIPGIGLPLLVIGTPISLYLQYLSYQELIDGNMLWSGAITEIESVIPSTQLKNEINAAYALNYPGFIGIDTTGTFKLWKLHIGTFNKPFQSNIEFKDENGLNIIQFKYQTDGQLYTVAREDFNLHFNPGDLSEEEPTFNFDITMLGKYGTIILIGGGIVLLLLVLPTVEKGYKSASRVLSNPKLMIVIALIVIGILFYLGKI